MKPMLKKLTITALVAGVALGPLPARAIGIFKSVSVQVKNADNGEELASLDKEKPSQRDKEKRDSKTPEREKEREGKKKYDDFKDRDKNGIDDRFEKPSKPGKEPPKKRKKEEPGEVNF